MGKGAGLRECRDWHCRVLQYPCSNGARGGTGRASSFWQAEKGCDMTRFTFYITFKFFLKFWSSLLHGCPLVAVIGGCLLAVLCRRLISVASLVAEHRF